MALNATMDTVYQDDFIHFSLFLPCYFKLLQLVRCLLYDSTALHIICSYSYKYSNTLNTKQKIQLATITSILTLNLYFPTTDTFSTVQQWTTAKQSIFNRLYVFTALHCGTLASLKHQCESRIIAKLYF